jgi:hypothetical protein
MSDPYGPRSRVRVTRGNGGSSSPCQTLRPWVIPPDDAHATSQARRRHYSRQAGRDACLPLGVVQPGGNSLPNLRKQGTHSMGAAALGLKLRRLKTRVP